jgi:hypothetical protein
MIYRDHALWQHAYPGAGKIQSVSRLLISLKRQLFFKLHALQVGGLRWLKPLTTSLVLGTLPDLTRGKSELIAENALLRQQLIILLYWLLRISALKKSRKQQCSNCVAICPM